MQIRESGPRPQRASKGWKSSLCEFAQQQNGDCKHPIAPQRLVLRLHELVPLIKAWQAGRALFVTVSAPQPSAQLLPELALPDNHASLSQGCSCPERRSFNMLWPVPRPLGLAIRIWWYSKAILAAATRNPVYYHLRFLGKALRGQLRHRRGSGPADGVPVRNQLGAPYPNSPVISSAHVLGFEGAMAFMPRGRFSRDHAVRLDAGAAGPTHFLSTVMCLRRQTSRCSGSPQRQLLCRPPSGGPPLPMVTSQVQELFCCINNPFMVKSVIHMAWPRLESSMLVVAAISVSPDAQARRRSFFLFCLSSWRW